MIQRKSIADPLPDPLHYGLKGDLSLGTDLVEWLHRRIDRHHHPHHGQVSNWLLWCHLRQRYVELLADSENPHSAALGELLLMALRGDKKTAGRKYRELHHAAGRANSQRAGTLAKAARNSDRRIAELEAAIDINEGFAAKYPGRHLSSLELARRVKIQIGGNVNTIRRHLASAKRKGTAITTRKRRRGDAT